MQPVITASIYVRKPIFVFDATYGIKPFGITGRTDAKKTLNAGYFASVIKFFFLLPVFSTGLPGRSCSSFAQTAL